MKLEVATCPPSHAHDGSENNGGVEVGNVEGFVSLNVS